MTRNVFETKKGFLEAVASELKKVGGVSFVGIRNYLASSGELSNFLVNVGVSPQTIKNRNLEWFEKTNVEDIINDSVLIKWNCTAEDIRRAFIELQQAMINPNKRRSAGQVNAYEYLATGFKYGINTLDFYISGIRLKKKVIVPASDEYNAGARPLTRAKNYIRITYLKKQRTYKLTEGTSIILNGNEFVYLNPEISISGAEEYVSFFEIEESLKKATERELINMSK